MKTFMATIAAATVLTGFGTAGFGGPMAASGANDVAFAVQAQQAQSSSSGRRTSDATTISARCSHAASSGRHALRDRRTCAAVSRVVFVWNLKIDFWIGKVVREGDHFAVQAVADGAPGLIVLVREDGSLKILAVEGS